MPSHPDFHVPRDHLQQEVRNIIDRLREERSSRQALSMTAVVNTIASAGLITLASGVKPDLVAGHPEVKPLAAFSTVVALTNHGFLLRSNRIVRELTLALGARLQEGSIIRPQTRILNPRKYPFDAEILDHYKYAYVKGNGTLVFTNRRLKWWPFKRMRTARMRTAVSVSERL